MYSPGLGLAFLGHEIDGTGITPVADKVKAVQDFPLPTTLRQLRRFLGLINYYRQFIPKCSHILAPLTNQPRNQGKRNVKITLYGETLTAFNQAKDTLANFTKLTYLQEDYNTHVTLTTDVSSEAIGAVLHQHTGEVIKPLSFFSVKLTPPQKKKHHFFT